VTVLVEASETCPADPTLHPTDVSEPAGLIGTIDKYQGTKPQLTV
jgi:hypothetical protein